jgi:dephospho-CoA kinase
MKTKVIGLTGGIGSGKTTIANYFKSQGVPLYIADEEAKKILFTEEVITEIKGAFGDKVLKNGVPDRAKLAELVFNEPEKLKTLNSIIHPKVYKHFEEWLKAYSGSKFIIREAAILFESGSNKDCDAVILVTAPKEVRIQRVINRDNTTREKVIERMNSQWDDEKKAAMSNYIITNIEIDDAIKQAGEILKILNKIEK